MEPRAGRSIIKSEITRDLSNASVIITNARETPETCVPLVQHFLSLNVCVTTRVYAWPAPPCLRLMLRIRLVDLIRELGFEREKNQLNRRIRLPIVNFTFYDKVDIPFRRTLLRVILFYDKIVINILSVKDYVISSVYFQCWIKSTVRNQ